MSDQYDSLWDATVACREMLEDEYGVNHINGNCHWNVVQFAQYILDNTEFTPYIRWGAVDYNGVGFDDRWEAEDDGAVHFWLEVELDGGWVMADVFTMRSPEDDIKRGDATIAPTLPTTYTVFPETLYRYYPSIRAKDLVGPDKMGLELKVDPAEPNVFDTRDYEK